MDLSKKKKIKNMNSKKPHLKQKQKQTKQTTRTGTESQKWTSHGGYQRGGGEREKRYRE